MSSSTLIDRKCGKMFSSRPVSTTAENSSPFALCTVSSVTPVSPWTSSVSLRSDERSRNPWRTSPGHLFVVLGRRRGERVDVADPLLEVPGMRAREVLAELGRIEQPRDQRQDRRGVRRLLGREVEGVVERAFVGFVSVAGSVGVLGGRRRSSSVARPATVGRRFIRRPNRRRGRTERTRAQIVQQIEEASEGRRGARCEEPFLEPGPRGLVQREPARGGEPRDLVEGRLPDPARGRVHGAQEREIVVGREQQAQVREQGP
jgi:hypothetical protein